jgi:hypothetical protein
MMIRTRDGARVLWIRTTRYFVLARSVIDNVTVEAPTTFEKNACLEKLLPLLEIAGSWLRIRTYVWDTYVLTTG